MFLDYILDWNQSSLVSDRTQANERSHLSEKYDFNEYSPSRSMTNSFHSLVPPTRYMFTLTAVPTIVVVDIQTYHSYRV
jgi:hypothetical protein